MALNYGVTISEVDTALQAIQGLDSSLPVIVGLGHYWQGKAQSMEPILCNSIADYKENFGNIAYSDDGKFAYSLDEAADYLYNRKGIGRAVFIAANDITNTVQSGGEHDITATQSAGATSIQLNEKNVFVVGVTEDEEDITGYSVNYDADGTITINNLPVSSERELTVTITALNPQNVGLDKIVEAIDGIDEVFARLNLVAGLIVCPKFSYFPQVAAKMVAKAKDVASEFTAFALIDVATNADSWKTNTGLSGNTTVTGCSSYDDILAAKTELAINDSHAALYWPCGNVAGNIYHLSLAATGEIVELDDKNGTPVAAPSNHATGFAAAVLDDSSKTVVYLTKDKANYVREQGVNTLLMRPATGLSSWGCYTAAKGSSNDVKDYFVNVRRMFIWIGNSLISNFFSRVDAPANRLQIESIKQSANQWLNGLIGSGALLYGRVDYLDSENPTTDTLAGKIRFHVYLTVPTPMQQIDFVLEYDVNHNALGEE